MSVWESIVSLLDTEQKKTIHKDTRILSLGLWQNPTFLHVYFQFNRPVTASFAVGTEPHFLLFEAVKSILPGFSDTQPWVGILRDDDNQCSIFFTLQELLTKWAQIKHTNLCRNWNTGNNDCKNYPVLFRMRSEYNKQCTNASTPVPKLYVLVKLLNNCLSGELCGMINGKPQLQNLPNGTPNYCAYIQKSFAWWCKMDQHICRILDHVEDERTVWLKTLEENKLFGDLLELESAYEEQKEEKLAYVLKVILDQLKVKPIRSIAKSKRPRNTVLSNLGVMLTLAAYLVASVSGTPSTNQQNTSLKIEAPLMNIEAQSTDHHVPTNKYSFQGAGDAFTVARDMYPNVVAERYNNNQHLYSSASILKPQFPNEAALPPSITFVGFGIEYEQKYDPQKQTVSSQIVNNVRYTPITLVKRFYHALPPMIQSIIKKRGMEVSLKNASRKWNHNNAAGFAYRAKPLIEVQIAEDAWSENLYVLMHEIAHTLLFAEDLEDTPEALPKTVLSFVASRNLKQIRQLFQTVSGISAGTLPEPRLRSILSDIAKVRMVSKSLPFLKYLMNLENPTRDQRVTLRESLRDKVSDLYASLAPNQRRNPYATTYAYTNEDEYFAEVSTSFIGASLNVDVTGYRIGPRWLQTHDPEMFSLLQTIYGNDKNWVSIWQNIPVVEPNWL